MSFESRELTTQVFLGGGDKSPCHGGSCRNQTKDDDMETCDPCFTTRDHDTDGCVRPDPEDPYKKRSAAMADLSLLHRRLRDTLATP